MKPTVPFCVMQSAWMAPPAAPGLVSATRWKLDAHLTVSTQTGCTSFNANPPPEEERGEVVAEQYFAERMCYCWAHLTGEDAIEAADYHGREVPQSLRDGAEAFDHLAEGAITPWKDGEFESDYEEEDDDGGGDADEDEDEEGDSDASMEEDGDEYNEDGEDESDGGSNYYGA